MKKPVFIRNGIFLTCVTMGMQVVELYLGIFISKILGAEGMGIFQLMSSVYGLAATMGIGGIYFAVTRLTTRELELGSISSARGVVKRAAVICLVTSILATTLLNTFAGQIAHLWIKNPITEIPLRILAFSMPFSAISVCFNSYFVAARKIKTVALSIVNSQLSLVLFTMASLGFFQDDLQGHCIAMAVGSLLAEAYNMFSRFLLFSWSQKGERSSRACGYQEIAAISFPIGISSCIRSFLNMLQNILIPIGLVAYGLADSEAMSAYGVVKGMAIPLVVFPASILSTFVSLLIPEISRSYETGNKARINRAITKSSSLTILFSIALTGIYMTFGQEIGYIAYGNDLVGSYIKLLAPLVTFMFLDDVVDCALKGLNQQLKSLQFNIVESLVRVALLFLFVPKIGIRGYILVIFVGNILNFAMSYHRLAQISDMFIDYKNWVVKPTLCITAACLFTRFFLDRGLIFISYRVTIVWAIASTCILFGILVWLMQCIDYSRYDSFKR